ncbi:MAG: T9SS type A sorting domain-containing protein [Bacteroidetes bacterium]|nr:MAG: T9SS type A sorting domain-containing protein [Bacteroidota bacterium]
MSLKRLVALGVCLICFSNLYSQNQDRLWMMGYGCCGSPNFTGINMDFRSGSLVVTSEQRHFNFSDTNGQICDSLGNPLFFTNGIFVSNALDDTMLNGGGLNPSAYTASQSVYGLRIPQANLVLPMPGDNSKFYLIHSTADDMSNTYATYYLYYSIIDMTLDGGLGGVVQKNTVLLHDSLVGGMMTATKHANGRDWWLVAHQFRTTNSFRFLLTPNGVQGPWIDNLSTWRNNYFGQAVFSQDGSKYVYYEPYGDLDIWDFDRCTGIFSNQIHVTINDSTGAGGAAFSRTGRFLYVSSINYVYQFDMHAVDVGSSKTTVAVYDGYTSNGLTPTVFFQQQLAPDGRIYINSSSSVADYHVINSPDSAGLACDLQQHSIRLPGYSVSLPNHPNYYLGAEFGSACDSLTNDIPRISNAVESFYIFPNPARDNLYITQSKSEQIQTISFFNSLGQVQAIGYNAINNGEYVEANVSDLSSGIYYLEILTARQKLVKKFIKD